MRRFLVPIIVMLLVTVHLGNYIWAEFATESVVDSDGRGHEPRTASR